MVLEIAEDKGDLVLPKRLGKTMLTVQLPSDFHARVKSKAALGQSSMQEVVQKALEQWLAGASVPGTTTLNPPIDELSKEFQDIATAASEKPASHWHSLLNRILRSGHRIAMQVNLAAFDLLVRETAGESTEVSKSEKDIATAIGELSKIQEDAGIGVPEHPPRPRKRSQRRAG